METNVNNKCGAFTSLEQSNKLEEILPLESADMCYIKREINDTFIETPILKPIGGVEKSLCCWSLAALLGVLPEKYTELIKEGGMYRIIIKDSYMTSLFYNPVDACYEMILELHELNLL